MGREPGEGIFVSERPSGRRTRGRVAPDDPAEEMRPRDVYDRIQKMMRDLGHEGKPLSAREMARRADYHSETQFSSLLARLRDGRQVLPATLQRIAKAGQRSLTWLITGRESVYGVRVSHMDGWAAESEKAARDYPFVPDFAITEIGRFRCPEPLEKLNAVVIRDLALAWLSGASDRQRMEAEHRHLHPEDEVSAEDEPEDAGPSSIAMRGRPPA